MSHALDTLPEIEVLHRGNLFKIKDVHKFTTDCIQEAIDYIGKNSGTNAGIRLHVKLEALLKMREKVGDNTIQPKLQQLLDDVEELKAKRARAKSIIEEVADKHNIGYLDILSESRYPPIVLARKEACIRIRMETKLSFPQIADCVRKTHPTVMRYIKGDRKQKIKKGVTK